MNKKKKIFSKIIKKSVEKTLKRDACNTTCTAIYQPRVPLDLKRFSKIKND
jgi:hypothetical protein